VVLDDDSRLLLIHDEKTGGWYKFTHPGLGGVCALPACGCAGSGYPGDEVLLSWGGSQVVKYEPEGTGPDLVGEVDSEVSAFMRTREFATSGMGLQRLRKLRLYLRALPGEMEAKLETESGEITFDDSFTSAGETIRIHPVASSTEGLEFCRRVAVSLSGSGIGTIKGIKLEKRRVRD